MRTTLVPLSFASLLLLGACSRSSEPAPAPTADTYTALPVSGMLSASETLGARAHGRRLASPSGRYTAVLSVTERKMGRDVLPHVGFRIVDAKETALFESPQDAFAGWFSLWFAWDDEERLWVGSGDVGVSWWEASPNGWVQHSWEKGNPLRPPVQRAFWVSR